MKSAGGTVSRGTVVTLPKAICGDVLDRNLTFVLTVSNDDYEPITDVNGKRLFKVSPFEEYTIELAEFGQYHVTYTVEDTYGNRTTTSGSYTYNIPNTQSPALNLSGSIPLTVKVGELIIVPNIEVEETVILRVYIKTPI